MDWRIKVSAFLVLLLVCGCGRKPPEIYPVSGTVTNNGKPLAKATVRLLPVVAGLDGGFTAEGVTDEEGKYTLILPGDKGPGCYACETKVVISEGPMPPGSRADNKKGQALAKAHYDSLTNRPIPKEYGRIGTTPLSVVVSAEENEFNFEL